jgi:hypothetical protein
VFVVIGLVLYGGDLPEYLVSATMRAAACKGHVPSPGIAPDYPVDGQYSVAKLTPVHSVYRANLPTSIGVRVRYFLVPLRYRICYPRVTRG